MGDRNKSEDTSLEINPIEDTREREKESGCLIEDQNSDLATNISQQTIINPIDSEDEHIYLVKCWNGETHVDDSVNQSHVKVDDSVNQSRVKVDDSVNQSGVKVDDSVNQSGVKVDDSVNQSRVKVDDSVNRSRVKVDNSVNRSRVKVDDSVNQSRAKVDDSVNQSGVKVDEFVNQSGVKVDESVNHSGVKVDDSVNQSEIKLDDSVNQSRVKLDDSVNQSGVKVDDSVKQSGVKVDDSVNQSRVKIFLNIDDESEPDTFMEIENQPEGKQESYNATSNGTQSNDNEVCQGTETYKRYQMDNNIKTDKSPDELNFIYPTTESSMLEDSPIMQRPPSHITIAKWTKTKSLEVIPLDLDSISEEVDVISRHNSQTTLVTDLGVDDSDTDTNSNDLQAALQSLKQDESEDVGSCMDCIKPVQVKTWKEINQGDHVILPRSFYDHHAIVIKIIPPEDDNSQQIRLELIHHSIRDSLLHTGGILPKLKDTTETVNLKTDRVMICKYWGSITPRSPREVVKRAIAALRGAQEEFRYAIFDNNCEHFASWCVTGRRLSIQIRKYKVVRKIFFKLHKGFRGLSDELLRNQIEYEHGMLCKMCFERNEKMLGITRKKVLKQDDIQKGDIILRRYWQLQHCSVVLDVIKRKEKYIKCEIAHYAFKGPFTQKIIQSDILKVPFNGSVSVFDYSSGELQTYEPDEVVCRAKERIGEKMFAYFSNDSSHFARWCKLKLLS